MGTDSIISVINTIYSGTSKSYNESLTFTQGSASKSITRAVSNGGSSFNDTFFDAYIDVPIYKYDAEGRLYILKSVSHYANLGLSCNMAGASGIRHNIIMYDNSGKKLGEKSRKYGLPITDYNGNSSDSLAMSAFDYAITSNTIKIQVQAAFELNLISGNAGTTTCTGTVSCNNYIVVTYLLQPNL